MSVFGNYARYYDLLYRDKDYAGEAQFICSLLQSYAPKAETVLELGCGTGHHAVLLAQEGYHLHGVDLSPEMLARARDRRDRLPSPLASRLQFSPGDIRDLRLDRTFDVAISLFHVISYQTTNQDLAAAFTTVKQHLKPGGIFIFDVWYGPAVLSDRPSVRVKRLEDENIAVSRIAEPIVYANQNWVDVNYQVFIRDKNNHAVDELQEVHRMRYLFKPELDVMLERCGLEIIDSGEWMGDREPGFDTWGVYFIVRA
jgi:SAM-dependent methyltransferase